MTTQALDLSYPRLVPVPVPEPTEQLTMLVLTLSGAVDVSWFDALPGVEVLAARPLSETAQVAIVPEAAPVAKTSVRAGRIHLDVGAVMVRVAGEAIELTRQEFELLRTLMQSPHQVFSRQQLLNQAWGAERVGVRTVDVHVRRVRAKLGSEATQLVTVRGFGYRFEPKPVEPSAADQVRSNRLSQVVNNVSS